mmetsp:Transcript_20156/g.51117  ORF Transcript_20156/g.51117 Transcript_20156/m.51117 type:complete len:218 (-) Transcript_20156:287-940(-)
MAGNIYLYWPNIVGYIRVVLTCVSFALFRQPTIFSILYAISFLLDALDGQLARSFNQCSKFGAVLDMVTDRFSTAGLVTILALLLPEQAIWFMLLNVLDFRSHWLRMYSSLLQGNASHKASKTFPYLLTMYYDNRIVLGGVCCAQEFFYIFLYLELSFPLHMQDALSLHPAVGLFGSLAMVAFPLFLYKQLLNAIQLWVSVREVVAFETAGAQAAKQ